MANSRLEKLGTIFSRVTTLLRTGALKREDKPLWYDVYQVFPPRSEPSYASCRTTPEIQEIFYPEDSIRAKFHRKLNKRLPSHDFFQESAENPTRRAIELVNDMMLKDQSLSEDQGVDMVIEIFQQEGVISSSRISRSRRTQEFEQFENRRENEFTKDNVIEDRSLFCEQREELKKINDKSINVSKLMRDN